MTKYGMRDPVYCWYNSKNWGSQIKIIVGNNRMVIAKELGLDPIRAVITNFNADKDPLEGKELKTDEEIKSLFHLPDQIHVRRDKNGDIDQVTPPQFLSGIGEICLKINQKNMKLFEELFPMNSANFIFNYFLLHRDATAFLMKEKVILDGPGTLWGTWKDPQVPNTFSKYGDGVMETSVSENSSLDA